MDIYPHSKIGATQVYISQTVCQYEHLDKPSPQELQRTNSSPLNTVIRAHTDKSLAMQFLLVLHRSRVGKLWPAGQIWSITTCICNKSFIEMWPYIFIYIFIVYGCYCTTTAELNSYNRECMVHKA